MDLEVNLTGPGAGADDLPVLGERDAPELPDGAQWRQDGGITLTFGTPVTLTYRTASGEPAKSEEFHLLVLRRLTGADMRKVLGVGSRSADIALALSAGLPQAKMALLTDRMDAADFRAVQDALAALLEMGEGLPARAEEQDDGSVRLALREPATDSDGVTHAELLFHRLKGGDLVAMGNAKDREALAVGIARACGLTPKAAQGLFEAMDAADVIAAQRVIGFLSGAGRRTGR